MGACTWQNVVWSAQWIMDREVVFGAIQSIVLINGDNGVYCCSCFWGSGCGCCRNCFVCLKRPVVWWVGIFSGGCVLVLVGVFEIRRHEVMCSRSESIFDAEDM